MLIWRERDPVPAPVAAFKRGFLDDEVLGVLDAKNANQLDRSIRAFMKGMEFDRYALLVIHDDLSNGSDCRIVSNMNNTPDGFLEEWEDLQACRVDPVMQQAKRSTAPFAYGPELYLEAGVMAKWERQAPFGYAHGVCSTFHLPGNLHVFFGIDRVRPLPADRGELGRIVAREHYFGTFVQSAALALLQVERVEISGTSLSPRERECLQWAAEGKTAWETGMILSIAEGTVVKILASAIRRLDCANKPQAVVKALRLGLIH